MSLETQHFYDFGDFRIDLAEKVLLRDGKFIPVTPKVFETLCVLVENAGRTIEKDELIQKIWQDRFVEESNLTFNVGMLRKALGDDAAKPTFIETVPRRGYRFIAEVTRVAGDEFQTNGDYKIQSSNGHAANGHAVKANGANLLNGNYLVEELVVETPAAKISSPPRPRIVFYLLLAAAFIGVGAAAFFLTRKPPTFYERFGSVNNDSGLLSVETLSGTGDMADLNISPDGKLLVYNTQENGVNTIWLRQFASGKSVTLLMATDEIFHGTAFSNDGENIYYTHRRKDEPLNLSRISTLGGAPTRIISDLHSGWTFSPDEKQIAFGRYDEQGMRLMVADADGRNERQVFLSPKPRYMFGIEWSPDGKSIAYCIGNSRYDGGMSSGIYELNLADGTEKSLSDFKWSNLQSLKWLPDQSGLLVSGREKAEDIEQLWRVSIPGGQAVPITNNSSSLRLAGTSNDFTRLLATQTTLATRVLIAPKNDLSNGRNVGAAVFDVAWTRDGRVIFPTRDSLKTDIWQALADGGDKRQLTVSDSLERSPEASPDGRFIVYLSTQGGRQNVWRMNSDGSNQVPLTSGDGEAFPVFTPDSKWIVYISNKDKTLWRISIEGGAAEQISAERHRRVAISPDGSRLAHIGRVNNQTKLIVESFPACAPVQQLDAKVVNDASFIRLAWAQDGKSITYFANDTSLIGNLWEQSLDGGEPRKLTNFTSERISDFAFSPDGSQIALVRGDWKHDAVLLKGFK